MRGLDFKFVQVFIRNISVVSFFYLFYMVNRYFEYPFLRIGDAWFDRKFDDSLQVLKSAECYVKIGRSIYDQANCSYLYGSTLLDFINFFNLSAVNFTLIGELFFVINVIIFTVFSVQIYNKYGLKKFLLCSFIFISPPFHYLIERGNFDTLIILLLVISAILITKDKLISASIILGLASTFKFYTLPVLLMFLLYLKLSKRKYFFLHIAIMVISVAFVVRDYFSIREALGAFGGYGGTFGLKSLALYANHFSSSFNTNLFFLLTILIFFLIVFKMFLIFNFRQPKFSKSDSFSQVAIQIFGIQIVTCYLITMNNDYRLSILGLFLSMLLLRSKMNSELEKWILIFGSISLWLSYPSWVLQVLGDIVMFLTMLLIIFYILQSQFTFKRFKQKNDSLK